MPSFNASRYIEPAIESVLAIEGLDIELLIQDGGSTDDTEERVARIADSRIRFVSAADDGQSDALNRALARANGRWIGWLNADDLYDQAGVERLAAELFDRPLDFVYGDYATVDATGRELARYRSSRPFALQNVLRYGVYINCCAAFYRPELLRSLGGLDAELRYCMDYDLLLRIARHGVASGYVPGTVQHLRSHPDATTSNHIWGFVGEAAKVAFRNAHDVKRGRLRVFHGLAIYIAYVLTRPIWQTKTWRRIRPEKRL